MSICPLDLLDSGNYQTYNRKVAKELGSVNAAIMLSELVNRHNYHREKGPLLTFKKYEGEWFYYTVDKCEERTILSRRDQETAIKILEDRGLFRKKSIGIPPKRHFQLDTEKILEFVGALKSLFIKAPNAAMNGRQTPLCNGSKRLNNKEPYEEPYKRIDDEGDPQGVEIQKVHSYCPPGGEGASPQKVEDPKPKEFLKALDPSVHPSFALLVGLVGKREAEQCWMRAIRNDYDPEAVVRYCLKNDDTIKSPIKLISAAIRDKVDYTKKQSEKNNNDKPKSTVIKYDANKVETKVNFGEVMEATKWAKQNSIAHQDLCPVELIKKWKESKGNT